MYTVTTTYEPMKAQATRKGVCPGCSKPVRRTRTFEQTVNPWNKTADKSRPKDRNEVMQSVREEAAAWQPDPEVFRHGRCL